MIPEAETGSNRLLNAGCGATYHKDWVNIDFAATSSDVLEVDLRRALPFSNSSFKACYSSHVLEHLVPERGAHLLCEFYRILQPGGVVRIVVPDLERITRDYLLALQQAREGGNHRADENYQWTVIQLLDQSVRRRQGGEMTRFLSDPSRTNDDFVSAQCGVEGEKLIRALRGRDTNVRRPIRQRIADKKVSWLIAKARQEAASLLVRLVAGKQVAESFQEGLFRNSGEIHQWMYDRYSLARILDKAGFGDIKVCNADESRIPNFNAFNLDIVGGRVRKADSLYMEATKPPHLASL